MLPLLLLLAIVLWLLWAAACASIINNQPRRRPALQDEPLVGLAYAFVRVYVRLVHRVRVSGLEHVGRAGDGPLVIVSNHTAGVDPMLIQSCVRREIAWMMGRDMMMPHFAVIWDFLSIIPVEREGTGKAGRDMAALRRAVRMLKSGDVVGIFPEGHIPEQGIGEFSPGVGMLMLLSGAPALVVHVSGTPRADRAWKSLVRRSHSRVEFLGVVRAGEGEKAEALTKRLRELYVAG
jgi:1-acyl-sn-glycerol-3-phosphate acyltransferase